MKKIDIFSMPELWRGAVRPGFRMTTELLKVFDIGEKYALRARCYSGIRLIFETDAREMSLAIKFGAAIRPMFNAGIKINACTSTVQLTKPAHMDLPAGVKRLEIQLPHLVELLDIELSLDDQAKIQPIPETRRRIIYCGDSMFQGAVCSSPAGTATSLVAEKLDLDWINTSVGGARINAEHCRLSAQLPGDILLVALGTNDDMSGTQEDLLRKNIRESLVHITRFPGIQLVQLPIRKFVTVRVVEPVSSRIWLEELKNYPQIGVIDGTKCLPEDPSLFVDGVHPNDRGMRFYGEALAAEIRKYITR